MTLMRVRRGRIVGPLLPTVGSMRRDFARQNPAHIPVHGHLGPSFVAKASAREREIEGKVRDALSALAAGVVTGALVDALRDQDVEAVLAAVFTQVVSFRSTIQGTTRTLFEEAAKSGEAILAETFGLRFDLTDQRAIDYATNEAARLVVEIENPTRQAIRDIVARALTDGLHPYQAADLIENVVGLHTRYANAVYNYWVGLSDSGLSDERIAELVGSYYDRLLGLRAETIARTEILDAANQGKFLGWLQAIDAGYLSADATKVWVAAEDERTCPICGDLDGSEVAIDDGWDVEGEFVDMPPSHPNCRCSASVSTVLSSGEETTTTTEGEG